LRRLSAESSHRILRGLEQYEDFLRPQQWQNMVFGVKKLLNVGVDLTLWRMGKQKQPGQNERQILRI
jgi:hypothetical protein